MDIPQPVIFLAILLAIPLQMYLSPAKSSDLDYYVIQTKAQLSKLWKEWMPSFLQDSEEISEKHSDNIIEDVHISEEDAEKGYFGGRRVSKDKKIVM